jgi:DNA processing protein
VIDVAWVALSQIRGMGTATLQALITRFGSATAVFDATDAELLQVRRVGQKTVTAIRQTDLTAVNTDLQRWQAAGVQTLVYDVPPYPSRLAPPLPDPPPVLFVQGDIPPDDAATVAVVGTRNPSAPMRKVAYQLGYLLGAAGYVVVSGLAFGVDAAAHRGALDAPNGRTMAVLGCGVGRIYPAQHTDLAAEVQARGALLAEVSPDTTVATPWLVARNRLISGLSDAVIVVETATNGGSMHTARAATRQGRRLLAVDNAASGNRHLIDGDHAAPLLPDLTNLSSIL